MIWLTSFSYSCIIIMRMTFLSVTDDVKVVRKAFVTLLCISHQLNNNISQFAIFSAPFTFDVVTKAEEILQMEMELCTFIFFLKCSEIWPYVWTLYFPSSLCQQQKNFSGNKTVTDQYFIRKVISLWWQLYFNRTVFRYFSWAYEKSILRRKKTTENAFLSSPF